MRQHGAQRLAPCIIGLVQCRQHGRHSILAHLRQAFGGRIAQLVLRFAFELPLDIQFHRQLALQFVQQRYRGHAGFLWSALLLQQHKQAACGRIAQLSDAVQQHIGRGHALLDIILHPVYQHLGVIPALKILAGLLIGQKIGRRIQKARVHIGHRGFHSVIVFILLGMLAEILHRVHGKSLVKINTLHEWNCSF